MLVYRLEHPETKNGPFCREPRMAMDEAMRNSKHPQGGWGWHYHNDISHGPPNYDGLPNYDPDSQRCACASPKQLVHWFPSPARKALAKQGYELCIYDLPDHRVKVGYNQVLIHYTEQPIIRRPL